MNLSRNNDLKPVLVYKDPKEAVPFSKIVVPSSMRSPLWKYFGFPADANKEIITKSKIVCGICRSYIAYNKNTTNLSTHLNCRHPEVFNIIRANKANKGKKGDRGQFVCPVRLKSPLSPSPSKRSKISQDDANNWLADDDDDVDDDDSVTVTEFTTSEIPHPKEKPRIINRPRSIYKPKYQLSDELTEVVVLEASEQNSSLGDSIVIDSNESQFIDTIDYSNKDFIDDRTEIIAEVLETSPTVDTNRSKDEFLSSDFMTINDTVLYKIKGDSTSKVLIASKPPPKIANKMSMKRNNGSQETTEEMKQIKKFLIKDLIPPSIIDGAGFKELITFFSQDADIPSSFEVERSIEQDFNIEESRAKAAIRLTVNKRNYSFSFHKLGNSSMVEVSMNSWLSGGSWIGSLDNQIFCITKDCVNFIRQFADSLSNCSAFIVDFDLNVDGLAQDVPVVPTFSYVTKMAFEECMQLSAVQTALKFDKNLLSRINKSFTWLHKFEHLSQYLNESINAENTQVIQLLVECLQPLKNCLDVLAFITSTHASIMKPLALQLINQHYTVADSENDDDNENTTAESDESDIAVLEKDLKRTIHRVLHQKIIENQFLTFASFLDPRFQRLTTADDLNRIHDEIEKDVQNEEAKSTEKTQAKSTKLKMEKSFGLSSLFSNISPATQSKAPKNRFDMEFRSYTQDVSLDMELCPLEWWAENDSLFPNIKQYVNKYFCVPSFVNNLHRLPLNDQEELDKKYDRFANDINDKLLWLHLADLRQKLMDS